MKRSIVFLLTVLVFIYILPQSAIADNGRPKILRVEQLGKELSQDANNPTRLPYFHTLKFVGNDACKDRRLALWIYVDGLWSKCGVDAEFDGNSVYSTNNGRYFGELLDNRQYAIKYVILDGSNENNIISESPTYYVIYLDERSSELKLVNGVDIKIKLTTDQLIIETKAVYPHFNGWPVLLKDKTTGAEQTLEFYDNPNVSIHLNKYIFSNLSIDSEHIYEITISSGTWNNGKFDDFDNFKQNLKFVADVIVDLSKTFTDVPDNHWAYEHIKLLAERRVIGGYEDGSFRPTSFVSRSEFAKMILLSLQIPLTINRSPSFADVQKNHWAFDYIETVKPYMTGYKSGDVYYFKPSAPAVREDLSVALVKALDLQDESVNLEEIKTIFSDYADISPNLRKYVLIAYNNQLINGYPDGTFRAQKAVTRAEAAAMLSKVYQSRIAEKVTFD